MLATYAPVVHVAFDGDPFAVCGAPAASPAALRTEPAEATCSDCLEIVRQVVEADDAGTDLADDPPLCPVAQACESCRAATDDLAAEEADTPVGVICLTLCASCATTAVGPRLSCPEAVHRLLAHCAHTGLALTETREQEGVTW
jgi:hypothetical protein